MSQRAKRVWIGVAALGGVLIYAILTLGTALASDGCEGESYAALQTVRCDSERGHAWDYVQAALIGLGAVALLVAIGWALRRASFRPLVAAGGWLVLVFVAANEIGGITLAARPLPRLTGVRILDRRCPDLCAGGLRVAFTNDRTAPVSFDFGPDLQNAAPEIADYQYLPELAESTAREPTNRSQMDFGPGSHVVRIALIRRTSQTHRARPLRPGVYGLDITADVVDPGNQYHFMTGASREFTILAGG